MSIVTPPQPMQFVLHYTDTAIAKGLCVTQYQSYRAFVKMTWWPLKMICVKNKCQSRSINGFFFHSLWPLPAGKNNREQESEMVVEIKLHFRLIVKLKKKNTHMSSNGGSLTFEVIIIPILQCVVWFVCWKDKNVVV